jgi:hypothetical protein
MLALPRRIFAVQYAARRIALETKMTVLQFFTPPADQNDFSNPADYKAFTKIWSRNVDGFTQQAILGNPWTATYSAFQNNYIRCRLTFRRVPLTFRIVRLLAAVIGRRRL